MLKRAVLILTSAVALFAFLCSTVSFLRNEKIETIFLFTFCEITWSETLETVLYLSLYWFVNVEWSCMFFAMIMFCGQVVCRALQFAFS